MSQLLALGALAIALVAGALCFVLWRARALRRRDAAVLAEAAPDDQPPGTPIYRSDAALYHGTRFADGSAFLPVAWSRPAVGELWCTATALYLRREAAGPGGGRLLGWRLDWIDEATLHRAFAPLAGKELPVLRLRFRRGGQLLVSELSLRGGRQQLEALRREIHLRQASDGALDRMRRLAQAATEFGPPET